MADLTVKVDVGLSNEPVVGYDTIIWAMPDGYYVVIEGKPTLVVQPFLRLLREVAVEQATKFGLRLQRGEYVVTKDQQVVAERGTMHDCDDCRAGTEAALKAMREQPDMEMIVGNLFWCD